MLQKLPERQPRPPRTQTQPCLASSCLQRTHPLLRASLFVGDSMLSPMKSDL